MQPDGSNGTACRYATAVVVGGSAGSAGSAGSGGSAGSNSGGGGGNAGSNSSNGSAGSGGGTHGGSGGGMCAWLMAVDRGTYLRSRHRVQVGGWVDE